jgi:hypothetical protein
MSHPVEELTWLTIWRTFDLLQWVHVAMYVTEWLLVDVPKSSVNIPSRSVPG